jgi:hypothetical protein
MSAKQKKNRLSVDTPSFDVAEAATLQAGMPAVRGRWNAGSLPA